MSVHDRLREHDRLRLLLTDLESAAAVGDGGDGDGDGGRSWAELRRAYGELVLSLFEHMAREEMTPELGCIARLHAEHDQQRTLLRAALADLADETRDRAEIGEEMTWLARAIRKDMEEEERAVLGPVTDRVAEPPRACRDVMRRPVRFVLDTDTVGAAARAMLEANVGFLVVCDADRRAVGAVTDRDLAVRVVAEGRGDETPVSAVMTRTVVSCRAADPLALAERVMSKERKSRIVCTDDDDRVCGVISIVDLSQAEDADAPARAGEVLRRISRREVRRRA